MFKIKFSGKQKFKVIWFGQSISLLGTAMTRFALLTWVYEESGNATSIALLGFFSILPFVLFSPIAGTVIDRFDRKKIMILSELGAKSMTIILLILYLTNGLDIIHIYIIQAFAGIFESFQFPTYFAIITMLLSKKDYIRASGMRSFSNSLSQVVAPIIAGFLLVKLGLKWVMLFDVITFFIVLFTLLLVTIQLSQFKIQC